MDIKGLKNQCIFEFPLHGSSLRWAWLEQGLDQMTSRDTFQLDLFHDSSVLSVKNKLMLQAFSLRTPYLLKWCSSMSLPFGFAVTLIDINVSTIGIKIYG